MRFDNKPKVEFIRIKHSKFHALNLSFLKGLGPRERGRESGRGEGDNGAFGQIGDIINFPDSLRTGPSIYQTLQLLNFQKKILI